MSTVKTIRSRSGSPADEVAASLNKRRRKPLANNGSLYAMLGGLCARRRRSGGLSLRDVSRLTGVSASALSRVENAKVMNTENAVALANWLGVSLGSLGEPPPQDVACAVQTILLGDPKLTKPQRQALCDLFEIVYRQMTNGNQL